MPAGWDKREDFGLYEGFGPQVYAHCRLCGNELYGPDEGEYDGFGYVCYECLEEQGADEDG